MEGGRIVQVDEERGIYEHPRTRFVADFIGVSSILELAVVAGEGHLGALATPSDAGSVAVPDIGVDDRDRIAFSVRPEHIEVLPPKHDLTDCGFSGRVRSSAYLGSEVRYQVEVAGIGEILATSPASSTPRKPG